MLEQLIERISLLDDKSDSEENLKFHVTVWLLKELGYEERMFNFEHPICRDSKKNKHADIFIPVKPGKAMFVETKKYSKDLDEEVIIQLAEYMTSSHEIAWGILTNGRQIFLLNNSIDIYGKNPALQTVPEHSIIKSLQGSDENGQQESFKEKHTMGQ